MSDDFIYVLALKIPDCLECGLGDRLIGIFM